MFDVLILKGAPADQEDPKKDVQLRTPDSSSNVGRYDKTVEGRGDSDLLLAYANKLHFM